MLQDKFNLTINVDFFDLITFESLMWYQCEIWFVDVSLTLKTAEEFSLY